MFSKIEHFLQINLSRFEYAHAKQFLYKEDCDNEENIIINGFKFIFSILLNLIKINSKLIINKVNIDK